MKILCGLGNPGREYEQHRHNVGFRVAEAVARALKVSFDQRKFDAELAVASLGQEKLLLLKPQTFMNLSGQALGQAARFYKVAPADVLVVHDELDLPFGRLQLKVGGGTGGHNGLSSMLEHWGEQDFARLRFGIGKPQGPNARERVVGWVLGNFAPEEAKVLEPLVDQAAQGCLAWARDGLQKAMNAFNRK